MMKKVAGLNRPALFLLAKRAFGTTNHGSPYEMPPHSHLVPPTGIPRTKCHQTAIRYHQPRFPVPNATSEPFRTTSHGSTYQTIVISLLKEEKYCQFHTATDPATGGSVRLRIDSHNGGFSQCLSFGHLKDPLFCSPDSAPEEFS